MTESRLLSRLDLPWLAGLLGLVIVLLAAALFDDRVFLGGQGTDTFLHFFASRTFGFEELAAGRIAQWNPHTYCGAPYLGSMQSALLYPPNLIFLALPTSLGINWSIALHLGLLAGLTYAWARSRGVGPQGSFLAGCIGALGGASFLHVYAGHLSNVCTMAWTPLVFMAIDRVVAAMPRGDWRRAVNWCLAGAAAVAMQVYAGHPQYLFYTGVAAVLYSALLLGSAWLEASPPPAARGAETPPGRRATIRLLAVTGLTLCTIYPLGAALGAAQLLPGISASRETIRSVPVPFSFAAMFGFPPENLLTLVTPFLFGDMQRVPYWGRCYLWEMCLFVGVVGAVLAAYAAWPTRGVRAWLRQPATCVPVCMVALLLLLALGNNTPLFSVLYHWVPGFGKFRGISKFIFQASLFIALLAGMGFDRLERNGRAPAALVKAVFALAAIGIVGGFFAQFVDLGPAMRSMLASQECYLAPAAVENPGLQQQARLAATRAVLTAGFTAMVLGLVLKFLPSHRLAIHIVLALGVGELLLFASRTVVTSPVGSVPRPEIAKFIAEHPGDYRVLDLTNPDAAMAGGYDNIWGYAPDLTRRYGEFMAFTQDMNPDEASPYVNFKRIDPLYKLLRLKYAFVPKDKGIEVVECPDPLPRAFLVHKYRVIKDRDAMFAAMRDPSFDPRSEVLLEEEPYPTGRLVGDAGPDEGVTVTGSGGDLDVAVTVARQAILVLTQAYSSSWIATGTGTASRTPINCMPAFYAMVAIPLEAGGQRLMVRHAASGLATGSVISLTAVTMCIAAAACTSRRRMQSSRVPPGVITVPGGA